MKEVHVHPVRDLIEHEFTEKCPCSPEQRPVEREDGGTARVVVHRSLDGSEPGLPAVALEPDTLPNRPLTADRVVPLMSQEIG